MFGIAAAFALLGINSLVAASGELKASPFMTATQIRDQFDDKDFVFDFNPLIDVEEIDENGGQAIAAQITQFPALVNGGIGAVLLGLEPCGMNVPHVHPRGTELLFSINSNFRTVFIEENGSDRVVENDVKPFMATIFPQGVLHTEVNLGCDIGFFISGFNSEDPGLVAALQQLFLADTEILEQAFQQDAKVIDKLAEDIPANVAPAIKQCRQRCMDVDKDFEKKWGHRW